tara:strand:+ start:15 stop:875 length:861 start_codon:yes stop_codon:yes gene_type:complete
MDDKIKNWSKEADGYVWIPTILQLSSGILYPVHKDDKMKWAHAPIVEIPEEEQKNYPIEGKDNEFYETKFDTDNEKYFDNFALGILSLGSSELPTLTNTRIPELYKLHCDIPSDIHEHLPVIKKYAEECDHITEMGVRWIVSTWALLMGQPKKLVAIDYENPSVHKDYNGEEKLKIVEEDSKKVGIDFEFLEADTRKIEIEPTDLLFIDTEHNYDQLKAELEIHPKNAKKYMMFHDTVSFAREGMDGKNKGLMDAIEEFLEDNNDWKIKEHYENNNGLLIMERVNG